MSNRLATILRGLAQDIEHSHAVVLLMKVLPCSTLDRAGCTYLDINFILLTEKFQIGI